MVYYFKSFPRPFATLPPSLQVLMRWIKLNGTAATNIRLIVALYEGDDITCTEMACRTIAPSSGERGNLTVGGRGFQVLLQACLPLVLQL